MEPKKYLAVFILPAPKPENARIRDALEYHSGGDFKMAFTYGAKGQSSIIGYLFTTNKPLYEIGFGTAVLNEDSFLLLELGDLCAEQGLNVAYQWMQAHRARR